VSDRLLSVTLEDMAVYSVVKAELFYGALLSNNLTQALERQQESLGRFASLPFTDEVAII
jgi:tRNA(fMet)-specific endonuclease VapC